MLLEAVTRARDLEAPVHTALDQQARVHIQDFIGEGAARPLYEAMQALEWRVVLNGAKDTYDFKLDEFEAMAADKRAKLDAVINNQARGGFQFLFDSYRISDAWEAGVLTEGALAEFFQALNSPPVLEGMRALTGEPAIAYIDAQATRYRHGHFLTAHDDDVAGKHRLLAFILNLTPHWRVDWGGLLMFHSPDGHVAEAYCPRWGALNILRVGQTHSVSMVAPFAGAARYSITGWMRSEGP